MLLAEQVYYLLEYGIKFDDKTIPAEKQHRIAAEGSKRTIESVANMLCCEYSVVLGKQVSANFIKKKAFIFNKATMQIQFIDKL